MDKYTLQDVVTYFADSFILDHKGEAYRVAGAAPEGNALLLRRKVGGNNVDLVMQLSEMDWKRNAPLIRLGYRELRPGGKSLYYLIRRVERITRKGLSSHTIRVYHEQYVADAMIALGLPTDKYVVDRQFTQEMADAAYNPKYTKFEDALENLRKKADGLGYALSNDLAMVLGHSQNAAVMILFQQSPAAYSKDGETWNFYASEYRDIIHRQLGVKL